MHGSTGELAMGMEVGSSGGQMASPNIVPMIDILLVLIIIFMVITPLTPKGLDTLVPQPSPPGTQVDPEQLKKTVVVQVAMGGRLKINNEDTNWQNLGPRIETIFKDRAEKVAFVKGDNDVLFMDVARAIDIMKEAGIDKVGLITAKLEAGQ
jgi:biopolymer transport protein ExbD